MNSNAKIILHLLRYIVPTNTTNMKKICLIALLCFNFGYAQDAEVVNWVNKNAMTIEDANPDTSLTFLKANDPGIFKDVTLFGFGEATHYTKEFFNLKAKFFKYLVENEGVTVFMMEESFGHADDINDYLAGGKGNSDELTGLLGFGVWRNREVQGLITWMKTYNEGKPEAKQLKFYGIDNQFGDKTNVVVKNFITKYNIKTQPAAAALLDTCSYLDRRYVKDKDLKKYLKQLDALALDIMNGSTAPAKELDAVLHALTVLKQSVQHTLQPSSKDRDKAMADNVSWVLQHEGAGTKAFIWAHNGHIAKEGLLLRPSMGSYLKAQYGKAYYSMGFSFGYGKLYGQVKDGKRYKGVLHTIPEPFKESYGAVFSKAAAAVFLLDVKQAQQDAVMKAFLSSNHTTIDTGGGGYNPLYKGGKEDIAELYDGLIFVREISHATYMEERLPESMRIAK